MRIAFVVPYVPNRVRTRPYNLIIQLANLGHDVDVFTVGRGENDLADAESLKSICRKVYYYDQPLWRSLLNSAIAVPSGRPLQSVYSLQYDLVQHLRDAFKHEGRNSQYDIVHIEHLRGSAYGELLKTRYPTIPIVWDSVDCISYLFRQAASQSKSLFGRVISRFELGRTQRAEASLLSTFDHVLVTSDSDKKALLDTVRNGGRSASISILSNGVDQDFFQPNPEIQKEPDTLIFSGKMSYHANISMVKYMVDEIMPLIWKHRPNACLIIAGKDPPLDVKKMGENPLIRVTGTVEDLRPYLWKSAIAVTPLVYGAGVQNKILEAMAVGLPVVSTSKALISLEVVPGRDILIGDTPQEFSAKVLHLLENRGLREKIGQAGRAYVGEHHNWGRISEQLVKIYNRLAPPENMVRVN